MESPVQEASNTALIAKISNKICGGLKAVNWVKVPTTRNFLLSCSKELSK